ncbi:hypothetical protein [Cellulomonas sp. HZM]|uniref:hypothetical protein n=1 Tax=Cellulomonas sp. HZM TaxID=1454010 RepID=UPI00049335FA|nr:hypothetical protein [Cellulomonas sp. HZM]
MLHAFLEVRLLPWRPRARVMKPDTLRDAAFDVPVVDDLSGLVISVVMSVLMLVAAPVIVVVLAIVLLPLELWFVVVLGLLVVVARFAGVIPWTVMVVEGDDEEAERFRWLPSALARVRECNGDRRVRVVWKWA